MTRMHVHVRMLACVQTGPEHLIRHCGLLRRAAEDVAEDRRLLLNVLRARLELTRLLPVERALLGAAETQRDRMALH
jgi:hypothetical protein